MKPITFATALLTLAVSPTVPNYEAESREAVKEIRAKVVDVRAEYERARRERDFIKQACIESKLRGLSSINNISDDTVSRMDLAMKRNELANVAQLSTKLELALERARALSSSAAGCIGQLAFKTTANTALGVELKVPLPDASQRLTLLHSPPAFVPIPIHRPKPVSPTL